MIEQLINHISQDTVNQIVTMISGQYRSYLRLINSTEFTKLFVEEYAPHNRQHGVSWAISSAFPSGSRVGELSVSCLEYGKGHTRPVLSNNCIEIYVLNSSTHFDAQYLHDRYAYNADNFAAEKLFCYIRFEVDHRKLKKVELCLPDENGEVVCSELLLDAKELRLVA